MTPMQKLVVVLLAMAIACFSTWRVDAWRYGKQLSDQALAHQSDMTTISNAANAQTTQALEKQKAAEQARADLDARATKEKTNDLAENERLRRAADDSARRLRIAGSCRADSGDVPSSTSTASLGNAGTVELTSIAGRTVFDIRAGIIADQAALRVLQKHVREACQ
ncbi:Rz lysis protein (endogenous virus) [Pseudomonas phage phiAH14a]|uniref:Spanin, inner membrane subunit n=1 Tax=Pseudomonas phage phiAH14a TaxID=1805958 RepID=A0A1B0VMJ3_9CAUD|nr:MULTISPECIES: lysis system i-spanin subunit Rz [unclassified Pseudomonas]YP_010773111.1 Rz lysis protein [Pseudomonas phage phiAH14a]AMW64554.1 Rz lysis protein [Pseudomonas phage phiAH14a]KAA0946630.1 lysis protein [Pseudomonas sp. ANT_H4]KAA0953269.1 lysis protein [Pseudomonas sp. ANT_H14]